MEQEPLQDALNELRLLVLQECEDGNFRQVLLSPTQFKQVSDACIAHRPEQPDDLREHKEVVYVHMNDDWTMDADSFLGLASVDHEAHDGECEIE